MQTISIQTPQQVAIEYETAVLWERAIAFFLDICIIAFGYGLFLLLIFNTGFIQNYLYNPFIINLIFILGPLASFFLYHFFSELLQSGQSWGKKLMGHRVIRLDGRPPKASDAALRAVFHLVETFFCLGILAALSISASMRRQRIGDKAANTVVVRQQNQLRFTLDDILQLNDRESYSPVYPQVKDLSEQDMLTVKTVLHRCKTYRNMAHTEAQILLCQRLCTLLHIKPIPKDPDIFLKTLLKDYIFLTR